MSSWAASVSAVRQLLRASEPCLRARVSPAFRRFKCTNASAEKTILGIESSCDDSCAAVVRGAPWTSTTQAPPTRPRLLSNVVVRQDHSNTGGIHPLHAAIWHGQNVPRAISRALREAGIATGGADGSPLGPQHIDAIAVTRGPGMLSSLSNGMVAAKTLASVWNKPLIYVHHMAAHALTPFLTEDTPPAFPFLTLLVSGGHTMLVLAESKSAFRILATTSDDSIGDAFDKAARAIGVPWGEQSGHSSPGAALEAFAAAADDDAVDALRKRLAASRELTLPGAMRGQLAFSFSGLKTTINRVLDAVPHDDSTRQALASLFQEAAVAQICEKLSLAVRAADVPPISDLICSGGVAANRYLRAKLRQTLDAQGRTAMRLHFPPLELCTDNAAMIAHASLMFYEQRTTDLSVAPIAKWSLEDMQ